METSGEEITAMEQRNHAEKLFIKRYQSERVLEDETQTQIERSVTKILTDALSKLEKEKRFKFVAFNKVIQKTANEGRLVPDRAKQAFESLKTYFITLHRMPWKKELWRLQTYSGYFQCRVKGHLENPESIICLVGFYPEKNGLLVLKDEPDPKLCLSVAFECNVAMVECELLKEFHRRMQESGVSIADVVRWRDTGELPEPRTRKIRDHHNGIETGPDSGMESAGPGGASIRTRSLQPGLPRETLPRNLPYIDEDETYDDSVYQEGTFEEHCLASIQTVQRRQTENERTKDVPFSRKSDEWDFVTDQLKLQYGNKYYEGERGDLTRHNRQGMRPLREDLSDEGIDVCEEPPQVVVSRHVRSRPRSRLSQDTGTAVASSGYKSATTNVYYPPESNNLSLFSRQTPISPRSPSCPTSAYDPQTPYSSLKQPSAKTGPVSGLPPRRIPLIEVDGLAKNKGLVIQSHVTPYGANPAVTGGVNWSCPKCTMVNSSSICSGCGRSRNALDIDDSRYGESITKCSQCTFENKPEDLKCAMCNNPLEKIVHTYV